MIDDELGDFIKMFIWTMRKKAQEIGKDFSVGAEMDGPEAKYRFVLEVIPTGVKLPDEELDIDESSDSMFECLNSMMDQLEEMAKTGESYSELKPDPNASRKESFKCDGDCEHCDESGDCEGEDDGGCDGDCDKCDRRGECEGPNSEDDEDGEEPPLESVK